MSTKIRNTLALVATCGIVLPAFSQQASTTEQYVVTYVETVPARHAAAEDLLRTYVSYGSRQPGVVRFDLEKEVGFDNRYAIRQEWQSAAAYTAFVNASQAWTNYLAPLLGAPFDNRLGNLVQ